MAQRVEAQRTVAARVMVSAAKQLLVALAPLASHWD